MQLQCILFYHVTFRWYSSFFIISISFRKSFKFPPVVWGRGCLIAISKFSIILQIRDNLETTNPRALKNSVGKESYHLYRLITWSLTSIFKPEFIFCQFPLLENPYDFLCAFEKVHFPLDLSNCYFIGVNADLYLKKHDFVISSLHISVRVWFAYSSLAFT